MEMMMLVVAWGNQDINKVSIVQTMPLAFAPPMDTWIMYRNISTLDYGESVAGIIPLVECANESPV
jgi:hypothetical protein